MVKPVLISGAGLSGLLLARSLEVNKIPFLIYDRDANSRARAQGYRIRISSDGLGALQDVLPRDEYDKFYAGTATTGGGGIHGIDAITGELKPFEEPSSNKPSSIKLGGDVVGVARGFLRECLFEGKQDLVKWGHQAKGYSMTESGVKLKFADGTESPEGCMLIAADGPQSYIAKQLTGRQLAFDTGTRMVHGQTKASAFKKLGEGVWNAQDDSYPGGFIGMITNVRPGVQDDEELGWVFVGSPGTFSAPGENFSVVGKVAADLSRELTTKWHENLQPILQEQNDAEAAFLKMSTAHPDGVPEWTNNPRVTLMGDAVHCMTPAGGVGANTALRDAAFIGRLLSASHGYSDGITAEYEKEMRVYASENVKMSYEAASKRFNFNELK